MISVKKFEKFIWDILWIGKINRKREPLTFALSDTVEKRPSLAILLMNPPI